METVLDTSVTEPRAHLLRARYRERFGSSRELPVPVESIAEDFLGLRIVERPLDVSGLLFPADRLVCLNEAEPLARRRFTLAHELGHWVCQCLEGTTSPLFCRHQDLASSTDRALEREANIFAAELLMPPDIVGELYDGSTAELSERLGVSELAIAWRLYNLGLRAEKPT